MDQFLLDARQAIRHLGAGPGFSAAVLIILAVGIGANTAAFSIVRGMLLQPLPYADSENIVAVGHAPPLNAEGFHDQGGEASRKRLPVPERPPRSRSR